MVGIQVGPVAFSIEKFTLLGEFCVVIAHYLTFGFFMFPFQLGKRSNAYGSGMIKGSSQQEKILFIFSGEILLQISSLFDYIYYIGGGLSSSHALSQI